MDRAELPRQPGPERLLSFQDRYNTTAEPFDWRFTRKSLDRHLAKIAAHESPAA